MIMEIKEVAFPDVLPLKRGAAADRVTLTDLKNTRWFAAYCDGVLAGSARLTLLSKSRARLGGLWVAPGFRGNRISVALTDRRLNECRGRVASVDTYAYNPKPYLAKGFRVAGKTTSAGATRVELVLAARVKSITKSDLPPAAAEHPQHGSG